MSRRPVKTFFPQTRLSELAARPGGILRSDAIEGALKSIEGMRGDGDNAIAKAIAAIEGIVFGARGKDLSEIEMHKVLRQADQIVTLAGTFCYAALDRVARSLCDLTDGLIRTKQYHAAPIAVHVQSLHLLAPVGTTLSEAHIARIEEELAKVLAHYQFESLAKPGIAEDGEVSLGPVA
jgi:hypothetical protein